MGTDVAIVSIYLKEGEATVKSFTERLGLTYRHVPDPEGAISASFGVVGIPQHVFIAPDGTVASNYSGGLMAAAAREKIVDAAQ